MRKQFLDEHPEKMEQAIDLLETTPFFRTVDPNLLKEVLYKASIFELANAEYLIREQNKSDRMVYILLEGAFDVYASQKFILRIDQPGNTIGEMAVISPNTPRSADAIASEPSKVIAIESSFLDTDNPQDQRLVGAFFRMFSNILSEKLRITTDRAKLYENAVLEKEEIHKFNKEITEVSNDLERELQAKLAQIKLYSQVVESNLDAIIITDETGVVNSGNPAFLSLFEYTNEEVMDLNLSMLFEPFVEDQTEYINSFSNGWKGEKKAFRKNNSAFPALISVSPIKTASSTDNETVSFAVVIRDITIQKEYEDNILKANQELKQTYEELENTLQELERSNKIKDRFLSNISTQLKTPVDSINNYAELASKADQYNADSGVKTSLLIQIMEESRKMEILVGNLLTMAEITSGLDLSLKVIKFNDFLAKISKAISSDTRLSCANESDASSIIADDNKLIQAFLDIFEYLQRVNGPEAQIHLDITQKEDQSQLEFKVYTGGKIEVDKDSYDIDAVDLDDGVELSLQNGELYLPLAKRIVDLHQGEMRVLSRQVDIDMIIIGLPLDPNIDQSARIKVAIIDEHDWDRKILKGIIEKRFALNEIYEFGSQIAALNALSALKPDLIVVDPFFAEASWNYEDFLKKLLAGNHDRVSTLVLSDKLKDMDMRNSIISLGVTDFLFKPFTIEDALFKLNAIVENKQRLYLLSNSIQKAEKTAATDGLTGLFNRKYFDEFIEEQFNEAETHQSNCAVIMIDVDNFKHYNDTNGHQKGDDVLKKVSKLLKDGVRRSDMVARYGGEEFVIVLPGTAKMMAEKIAEKLRAGIEKATFEFEEKQPKGFLSASFGVASYPENGDSPATVLKGADNCLYIAKEKGRNAVVGAEGITELTI